METTGKTDAKRKGQKSLFFKAKPPVEGFQLIASPANSPLIYQTFGLIHLFDPTDKFEGQLGNEEGLLTLLSGAGRVEILEADRRSTQYALGPRDDIFKERAIVVYLPPNSSFVVTAISPSSSLAFHRVPADKTGQAFVINPGDATPKPTGKDNWQREITLYTPLDLPMQRLVLGETVNHAGNWSSYPPHKHDTENLPIEYPLEEIYHFRLNPKQGFGMIRIYDAPDREDRIDETFLVQDGDTVIIPHGYHPVVVAPGYQIYYLYSLAGKERHFGTWSDDPAHVWVSDS